MKNSEYRKSYLLSLLIVIVASAYPLYMGIRVLIRVAQSGFVPLNEYPKYVIPYTPIALAVIVGVLLIPLLQKFSRKLDFMYGAVLSVAVFFVAERFMEVKPLIQTQSLIPLESWQMSLCYQPPEYFETRTWEAVDVLLGGYSPAFKIHFYLISIVIILSLLNCFYGFAKMICFNDYGRKKSLIIQSITSGTFLGMCIWACFTAFYRSGELTVSPLSAVLMTVFFVLLGVTTGVFVGSFTLKKKPLYSTVFPAGIAAVVSIAMYIGEMVLLNNNLYRFGQGVLFDGLGKLVLAPVDLFVIAASAAVTYIICSALNKSNRSEVSKKTI